MTPKGNTAAILVREEERGYAAAAHIFGAIPLWGLIFLCCLWVYFKERSREVVFHIQQAMMFQCLFFVPGLVWLLIEFLNLPVKVLNEWLHFQIGRANLFFLVLSYMVFASVCAVAAATTLLGKPFLYPVVGKRVLEGNLTKSRPEV